MICALLITSFASHHLIVIIRHTLSHMFHDKGIIVAGFAAIGKSTLASKYSDRVIDLESGEYQWDNRECENIPCDQPKGSTVARCPNPEWPENYYKAIIDAVEHYDIVLTSYHLKNLLWIERTEYLEDVLIREKLLRVPPRR